MAGLRRMPLRMGQVVDDIYNNARQIVADFNGDEEEVTAIFFSNQGVAAAPTELFGVPPIRTLHILDPEDRFTPLELENYLTMSDAELSARAGLINAQLSTASELIAENYFSSQAEAIASLPKPQQDSLEPSTSTAITTALEDNDRSEHGTTPGVKLIPANFSVTGLSSASANIANTLAADVSNQLVHQ